jgi:PAS domain S-box-containing protein
MSEKFSTLDEIPGPQDIARTQAVLDHMADGVLILDDAGKVVAFNQALEDLTGVSRSDALGRDVATMPVRVRCGDREHTHGLAPPPEKMATPGGTYTRQAQLVRRDGQDRTILIRYRPMHCSGGKCHYLIGVVRDLTDESEWQRARDLARAPENLGSFGYQLAHQILGPLNAIDIQTQLLTRLLRKQLEDDERGEIDRTLGLVREEIKRLGAMLSETLQLQKPESSVPGTTDPAALLADLAELIQARAEARGIEVQVDATEGLPRLRVDAERMRRALMNLALNSLEAMSSGGQLRLLAHRDEDLVKLTVSDDGPGLPQEVACKAFELFYTTKPDGTGMGLPLARNIIEDHGGTLRLVGGSSGAEFEISLPVV